METLLRAFVRLLVVKATKKENKLKIILKSKSTDFIAFYILNQLVQ